MREETGANRLGSITGGSKRAVAIVLVALSSAGLTAQEAPTDPGDGIGEVAVEPTEDAAHVQRRQTREAALAAAKSGDFAEAERQVRALSALSSAGRNISASYAENLATLSLSLLEDDSSSAAAELGMRAQQALELVLSARNEEAGERVRAGLWQGLLQSRIDHEDAKARQTYQRVLAIDPDNQEVIERLAALDQRDAVTALKIQEQEFGEIAAAAEAVDRGATP